MQNGIEFLRAILSILEHYLQNYLNFMTIGDFHLSVEKDILKATLHAYNLSFSYLALLKLICLTVISLCAIPSVENLKENLLKKYKDHAKHLMF